MFDLTVKNVPFCGTELLAVKKKESGKIYAGVNPILRDLGFDDRQIEYRRNKWVSDKSISKGVQKFSYPSEKGGIQEGYCIDIMKLPLALAKLEITPKMENEMPELAEKLEEYQDRCADVLAEAFLPKTKPGGEVEPKRPSLTAVTSAAKFLTELAGEAGCDRKIQLLAAKSFYNTNGYSYQLEIGADKQYWDTVHIARQVGICVKSSGKPADKAVNEIIRRIGVTEEDYTDTWESKGNWQGTVRKYSDSVIDRVKCWIADNDYPEDIDYRQNNGEMKAWHVTYQSREVA